MQGRNGGWLSSDGGLVGVRGKLLQMPIYLTWLCSSAPYQYVFLPHQKVPAWLQNSPRVIPIHLTWLCSNAPYQYVFLPHQKVPAWLQHSRRLLIYAVRKAYRHLQLWVHHLYYLFRPMQVFFSSAILMAKSL